MKYILLLGLLSACSGDLRASGNVSGTVSGTVLVKIDLSEITQYFTEYCAEKYPNDVDDQTKCLNEELAKFLVTLEGDK